MMAAKFEAKHVPWGLHLLLVTLVASLALFSGAKYVATIDAVDHSQALQSEIDATLSLLKDAETGQRGYLLTADDRFLEPYRAAHASIPERLSSLEQLLQGDPQQLARLAELEARVKDKIGFSEATLELHREGNASAALSLVRGGRGLQIMESIRDVCSQMSAETQRVLSKRHDEMHVAGLARWGIGAGWVLTVLLSLFIQHRDVKALQRSAEKLAESERHFRVVTENSNDLVRLLDLQGKTTYVGPSVQRLLGYSVEEFLALPALSMVHPEDRELALAVIAGAQSATPQGGLATYRLRHKSGEYLYFEARWSPHRNLAGVVIGVHSAGRDVTERIRYLDQLREQAERLRSLSLRDELTQLYNRRGFLEVAGQARLQAERDARSTALIFVDLNGMKSINDELGHDVGDVALCDTAHVLGQALAKSDVLARLGGDEFVAFSLDFSSAQLETFRKRLRALCDARVAEKQRPFRLSMSVGAAYAAPGSTLSIDQLLEHADAAMYEAKRARRTVDGITLQPPAKPD